MQPRIPFTEEQKQDIAFCVINKHMEFSEIAKQYPDRTVREIREEYEYHIKNDKSYNSWTEQEDSLLKNYNEIHGKNWDLISKLLGRIPNDVMTRYNLLEKYEHIQNTIPIQKDPIQISREISNTLNPPQRGIDTEINSSEIDHQMAAELARCLENGYHSDTEFIYNGYTFTKPIEEGGTSYTKECFDCSGNVYVAKIMKMNQKNIKRDQILNEIALMQELNHPNILKCIDYFLTPDNQYMIIILDKCERDLFSAVYFDSLTPKEKQLFFFQICRAVKYMHENNIAHRDLKIENILLLKNIIKLADFGFAIKNPPIEELHYGTYIYWPPEAFEGKKVDAFKADIYALGIVAYLLATRDEDFYKIKDISIIKRRAMNGFPINQNDELQSIAKQLTARDPDERQKNFISLCKKFFG